MNRFDPKAIVIAVLLSLVLDVLGGLVLLAVFGSELDTSLPPEQLSAALEVIAQGSGFLLAALLFSTATTIAGGYVAARLARAFPYFNAMAVGVVGIVLGVLVQPDVPAVLQPYLPIAVVAALDTLAGGLRASLAGAFDAHVFITSFLFNVLIAAFLVFLGDQLGVGAQLSTAVVVVLGIRIFGNAAAIRRHVFKA